MSLKKLKDCVNNLNKDEKNSNTYRAMSSFDMIENVDLMIKRYLDEPQDEKGAILLDVFGLLQGLFVAIDGLYDLAIGLTQYKYHININSNPILHELKYIRNDIVGHPTHRTYFDGGTGFSILKTEPMSKDKIVYDTYIYSKNKVEVKEKIVYFKELLENYEKEKNIILNDIYEYLVHNETKTNIPEKIYSLYETLSLDTLNEVEVLFREEYKMNQESKHRFFWRARLLKTLINWHDPDDKINRIILYMSKIQVSKMYDMALDMEHRRGADLYTALPEVISDFYKFMRKHEKDALKLIDNIHDFDHPLHQSDLIALMSLNPPKEVYHLLKYIKESDSKEKVYLIGSILKAYRPKK
jgi:hypothetical protein